MSDINICDEIITIGASASVSQKIERSEFIGYSMEAATESEARNHISVIQEKHRDATHNCFAYRIGEGAGEIVYSSDAGEPSGSAGRPILGAILSMGVTDTVVVVTRYFGGKKLGVPGLIKAYGSTARMALEKSGKRVKTLTDVLRLECGYGELNHIHYIIDRAEAEIISSEYGEKIHLSVRTKRSCTPSLAQALEAAGASLMSDNQVFE